ncbi:carbohydrate ABC transporter permease [Thermocaproicibacter melissae]|uniref:carbohydrate ABC transporter permease n=1 Tax=Thermocaproicibacter melissae TaxID=2966552 RepID=UPI0024B15897|nr:carbohydrate ABC transporter permease [Thermocaproicibacter melissae]WBY64499.1 carbohydrate ABC transporter permease [Thermocaproicibacter melissae]
MTHALKNSWKYILLVVICVVFLFPLAWALVCSVKPEAEILSYPPKWIPEIFTWSNYTTVLARYPYLDWAKNSIITAGLGTLLILLFSSLAAYALGRFEFRGKKLIYSVIVAMLLIPIQAYMIPLYLMCAKMGILNTYASIILPSVANVTSIFILTSFFKGLPKELEEAARIDGCGEFRIFAQIMLPLSKPALSTVTILTFISNWNSFLWPMIAIREDTLKTLPVGIAQFMGSVNSNAQFQYGTALAGCCMAVIPTLIVFLFLQRYFVEGIASTGIKG